MFRITQHGRASGTEIVVEGDLSHDCVLAVERCCEQARARGAAITVCLRNVLAADRHAQEFLVSLQRAGVRLSGRGVYISYLIEQCRRRSALPEADG